MKNKKYLIKHFFNNILYQNPNYRKIPDVQLWPEDQRWVSAFFSPSGVVSLLPCHNFHFST